MTFPSKDRAKPSMWIVRLLSLGATMLLILNLAGTSAGGQAPAPGQRVLVLYSDERLLPANVIMDEAIRAAFAAGTKNRVEFYSEFLDVARFPGEEQQQRQRDFCQRPPVNRRLGDVSRSKRLLLFVALRCFRYSRVISGISS
jgi:hypothetical protein